MNNDNINVFSIENGYIVKVYRPSRDVDTVGSHEKWYCVSPEEVSQRVERLLFGK